MNNSSPDRYNQANLSERAYQLIIDLVESDGGDGTGTLITTADTFGLHVDAFSKIDHIKSFYKRQNMNSNEVMFSDGNECIKMTCDYSRAYFGSYIIKIV